ncbi:zinc finger, CCHC-type containing protein [Tanacetum coccineum]
MGTMWYLFDPTPSDSLNLDVANRDRMCLCLFQLSLRDQDSNWLECLPAGSISTWEDLTIRFLAQFFPLGRTAKLRNDILTIGVMDYKVDMLMKDALLLMGRSEGVFRITSNEMYQLPPKLSRQKEFEHIVTNFILDQEERVWQLEEYMKVIVGDFMQLSSEVTRRLKEKMREEVSRMRKIEITKYPDIEVMEPLAGHKFLENHAKKTFPNTPKSSLCIGYVHPMVSNPPHFRKSIFGFKQDHEQKSQEHKRAILHLPRSIVGRKDSEIRAKVLIKLSSSPSTTTLSPAPNRYDPELLGVRFILRCEQKEIYLLELGWRVGLFIERKSRESATLSGLRKGETVKASHLLMEFWPTIRDGGFNVGNTKVASIRDPKVKLAHRCITTTIAGRKESTHRVTEIDLFYLCCIYNQGVICNIPYWLANVEPPPHVFKKKSLIAMGVVMELHNEVCFWPATREVKEEDDEADEVAKGDVGNEGAGGPVDMYRNMSQGVVVFVFDLQVIFDEKKHGSFRKFHWMILGGRFNQLSHVSSPLLSKPGEY